MSKKFCKEFLIYISLFNFLSRHAGVYTRAEAVRLSEMKLIKLQGLYREQITHLQHVLKQRRRSYLHDIRRERETYCN